jgi:hypothetical protein
MMMLGLVYVALCFAARAWHKAGPSVESAGTLSGIVAQRHMTLLLRQAQLHLLLYLDLQHRPDVPDGLTAEHTFSGVGRMRLGTGSSITVFAVLRCCFVQVSA